MNKTNKQQLIHGILLALKFISVVPFILGIIVNYDGYQTLINMKNYKPGLLQVDSLDASSPDEYGSSAWYAVGHIDSIDIRISIGSAKDMRTKKLVGEYIDKRELQLPVWYKADGELTLDRYSQESKFPKYRIWENMIKNLILFNGPLIIAFMLDWRFKREYKKLKSDS